MNAFNQLMWRECKEVFQELAEDTDCRVVILAGNGANFTGEHIGFQFISEIKYNYK